MKTAATSSSARGYRQGARAAATAATGERILQAFLQRIRTQWFDEITLDAIAADAGVTVQTVVRRFGGKEGLLTAACAQIREDILARRRVAAGDIPNAIDALARDYEALGELVMHMLAQEGRYPAIRVITDTGRRSHRDWVAELFAPWLGKLAPATRRSTLDALVVATDLYVWALIRRDLGRSLSDYKSLVLRNIDAALAGAAANREKKS